MMHKLNKKGFTLIELLAVIVILAVIALILTPVIMNIIENSREKAAEESINSYVAAANNASAVSLVDGNNGINVTSDKYSFETGNDNDALSKIEVSGISPTYVYLEFDSSTKEVKTGHFCIKGYNIDYYNGNTSKSANNYCGDSNSDNSNNDSFNVSVFKGGYIALTLKSSNSATWSSSDSSIAVVDNTGLVKGVNVGNVTITAIVGSNTSNYSVTVIPKSYYENGEVVYFNVSTGKSCTKQENDTNYGSNGITNNKTGCLKFYTFNDSSDSKTVNMILDHNTSSNNLKWATSTNLSGPNNATGYVYYQLLQDTNSWLGTEKQSNYTYTNATTSYSIKYGDDNAKSRFLTANDVAKITGNTNWNSSTQGIWFYLDSNSTTQVAKTKGSSKYAWLYDYTYGCSSYGCNIEENTNYNSNCVWGYWTSDSVSGSTSNVWGVGRSGFIDNDSVSSVVRGVRPVITVLKSNL